jgi:hypothetical protein
MCMFCRALFVLLYLFFWSLCCLFFFDIRILITHLVSLNSCNNKKHLAFYIHSIAMLKSLQINNNRVLTEVSKVENLYFERFNPNLKPMKC